MARPKLNALPQDSVLRAHLRRQADWQEDGPRLTGRETGNRRRQELLAEIDRIGRANHLQSQAAGERSEAVPVPDAGAGFSANAQHHPTGQTHERRRGLARRPHGRRSGSKPGGRS